MQVLLTARRTYLNGAWQPETILGSKSMLVASPPALAVSTVGRAAAIFDYYDTTNGTADHRKVFAALYR